MIFLIWTSVLIAVIVLYFNKVYSRFTDSGVKHLRVVPFFGNMAGILLRQRHFSDQLDKLYHTFKNERFVGSYEFIKPTVLIRDIDLVKKITIKNFEYFIDHRAFADVEPLFARNLFALKGEEWKDMRSTLSPAFTSSKIKLMVPFMEEVGDQMIKALKKKIDESKTGHVDVDCKDLTSRYANDVIASCAFGLKVDSHTDEEIKFYEMGKLASEFKIRQLLFFLVLSACPILVKVLRLWPPILALDRQCLKDYNMGKPNSKATEDFIMKQGEILSIPVWCFHHDPEYFPDPSKFDPERFSEENKHKINSMAYMPFGIGPRNCIGSRFALCELKSLLYQILLHMEVSPSERTCLPAQLSTESFNPRILGGHWLKFHIRDLNMIFLIWTSVLIAVIVLYFNKVYTRFSDSGVKHFRAVPFVGNMAGILLRQRHFYDHLDRLYHTFKNERFVGSYEFIRPTVMIRDIDLVKKITIKDFEYFIDHRAFADDKVEPLFSRNLFALKGEEWKDMRSTLSPAFTSSKIKLMIPFMEEVGDQMIRALKKKTSESKTGYIDVDCKDLTSRYTNDVIASCAFGLKVDSHTDEENQFYKMGKLASVFKLRQMLFFFFVSACPGLAKYFKISLFTSRTKDFFIELVTSTMKNREMKNIVRPDMIHLLMEAKKGRLAHEEKAGNDVIQDTGFATVEESDVGKKSISRVWSDIDLTAQAVLFFIAGFETISIAMSFALHELAVHPEVQDRLVEEIKDEHVKNGGKLSFDSIQNMTYMDMVTSEVLRLWPPVLALDRQCLKDYNMGKPNGKSTKDFIMKQGEILSIPVWCFHHDPEFFPDPYKFNPERFSEKNKHKINPMAYMPFGIGPRNCIGSRFALCELKSLLYQILLHVEVSPSERTRLPVQLSTESFNPRMLGGHWLRFKLRD